MTTKTSEEVYNLYSGEGAFYLANLLQCLVFGQLKVEDLTATYYTPEEESIKTVEFTFPEEDGPAVVIDLHNSQILMSLRRS